MPGILEGMADAGRDAVIWGITREGRRFRPGDWADRLAGLASTFGEEHRLEYSPLVLPVCVQGVSAVVVGRALATLEPRFYRFLMGFASDNALRVEYRAAALTLHQELVPPVPDSDTQAGAGRRPA